MTLKITSTGIVFTTGGSWTRFKMREKLHG
jgi:hypothetical protein